MLLVLRFHAPEPDFAARATDALDVLRTTAGFTTATIARSVDEPDTWVLTACWETMGAYRRAMSRTDVRQRVHPVLYGARDEPSVYEELVRADSVGVVEFSSDLGSV